MTLDLVTHVKRVSGVKTQKFKKKEVKLCKLFTVL